ncbi:hypothetical protein U0C82_04895 [Fulvimarina sp. 2208YS6-2-32]|uniref:Uncharacterized protein n=1 Tax=Fulvimarina uroteuthidis TaxID=3098149 RepID=A0ABU5I0A2_9HYPH|nr:hypothetical protein [Fulvimarina sp. 2208YS6-2-32]MDY8108490.1 hypothetical protein [Fulvimarina sp. 2208YS6-2-32]
MLRTLFGGAEDIVDCTVEISNTFESLHAHVRFDGGVTVEPGDAVIVHGSPISVPYGDQAEFRRTATIRRAGWFERTWTRLTGDFEFMELCEFSFSEKATL